ncbi:MAG: hypothetical protein Fur005_34190 [Roseiflexaceae bacterium]
MSAPLIETITNAYPHLAMTVDLLNPFERLCPISGEPQTGSTLRISYQAAALLLETRALRRYLASFAGENPHGVRDLEEAAQRIALDCANAVGVAVTVSADYRLAQGSMLVQVVAHPSPPATP